MRIARKTLLVGSGKGGVGKSTVAVNLAVSLGLQGFSVGLLDADIYGPSIPVMTGLRRMAPQTIPDQEGNERILPFQKFGVKLMSVGFFIEEARAANWRGPVLHGILRKMTHNIEWGELDYLLVDLPPGTGDIPLSLSQLIACDGALIVTTPQQVAALDALKAVNAFDTLNIPLLGVIENMAGFTPPDGGKVYHIFGEGKARALAESLQVPLLGSIPLVEAIRAGGDQGIPSAYHSGDAGAGTHFRNIGEKLR